MKGTILGTGLELPRQLGTAKLLLLLLLLLRRLHNYTAPKGAGNGERESD